jgi:hypothetical protein
VNAVNTWYDQRRDPRWRFGLVMLSLLIGVPVIGRADEPDLLVDSESAAGARLISIDADWNMTFEVAAGTRLVAARDVVFWGRQHKFRRGPLVLLADGSVVVGAIKGVVDGRLQITSRALGSIETSLANVRGILMTPPARVAEADRMVDWMLGAQEAGDQVLLVNGDRLTGHVSIGFDPETGQSSINLVPRQTVTALSIEVSTVEAVVFGGPNVEYAKHPRMEIGFRDGSRFLVGRIASPIHRPIANAFDSDDQEPIQLGLVCGESITVSRETVEDRVTWVQPLGFGRYVYLSDLEPLAYKQVPFLDARHAWASDHNVLGGHLRVHGHRLSKGIGMAPASTLAFELTGKESAFHAELAIDDRAGGRGSVVFRIFAGRLDSGRVVWEPAYESPIVRGGQPPLAVSVDLRSASRLALLVEFSERGDELDYADWLNPRLVVE